MVDVRFIEEHELGEFRVAYLTVFGVDTQADDEMDRRFRTVNSADTAIAAFDRGRIVGTLNAYKQSVTMPGGHRLPMAGVTHVTVSPTHRRRGILSEMMGLHLEQCREQNVPVSGLWASEEPIYGRFGYGPSTWFHDLQVDADAVNWPEPDPMVSVHPVDLDSAAQVLPKIYDGLRGSVAGWIDRSEDWWRERFFDPPRYQPTTTPLRVIVAEREGEPHGYLLYQVEEIAGSSEGTTKLVELMASDEGVRRTLWHTATHVDLFRNVDCWAAPTDWPLFTEADRWRRIRLHRVDGLWLRVLDVVAALQARTYERDGSIVFSMADESNGRAGSVQPDTGPTRSGKAAGTFRLTVEAGVGTCEPADAVPELRLSTAALAGVILGGTSATELARADSIEGEPASIRAADELFATSRAPHCPEVF